MRVCFNPVAGIHCNERLPSFPLSWLRHSCVSIPLPGFIVMKVLMRSLADKPIIMYSFNPVAGIHCNESSEDLIGI